MWPTSSTPLLLLLGLLPFACVLRECRRSGLGELVSLRSIAIVSFWLGFHLSPWAALIEGGVWSNFLLVADYVDDGLLFSTLSMLAFLAGYGSRGRMGTGPATAVARYERVVRARWLVLGALVSLTLLCLSVGGAGQAWKSNARRGEGQFEQRDLRGKLIQLATIGSGVADLGLAALATVYILGRKPSAVRYAGTAACLLIASLRNMGHFSRASGASFMLAAVFLVRSRKRKGVVPALVFLGIGWWLGAVGLRARNDYPPGVGWFLDAAFQQVVVHDAGAKTRSVADSNPMDSLSTFTRRTETKASETREALPLIVSFFWNLHPFPSEFVKLDPIGDDLAVVMRTVASSTGLPTPALGEMYYCFGYFGALLPFGLGMVFRWFEEENRRTGGWIGGLGIVLCLISLAYGAHNSTRAMTRPLLYGFTINRVMFAVRKRGVAARRGEPAGRAPARLSADMV